MSKKVKVDELVIDGTTYVPKESIAKVAEPKDGMPYVLLRTYSAGVHCGYLKSRNGKEAELLEAIRVFYWTGACSLSQLAMEGSTNPEGCKFAIPVISLKLTEVIEEIEMTEKAKEQIINTKSWKK